jgi:hypothetical protein
MKHPALGDRVRAIDTHFAGNWHRSRTEARWAMALHIANEPYEYEPEGVRLRSSAYLPDFWLARRQSWLEVKPDIASLNPVEVERASAKAIELADATGFNCYLVFGRPNLQGRHLMFYPPKVAARLGPKSRCGYASGTWDYLCPFPGDEISVWEIATDLAAASRFEFGQCGPPQWMADAVFAYQAALDAYRARREIDLEAYTLALRRGESRPLPPHDPPRWADFIGDGRSSAFAG